MYEKPYDISALVLADLTVELLPSLLRPPHPALLGTTGKKHTHHLNLKERTKCPIHP